MTDNEAKAIVYECIAIATILAAASIISLFL